ncbi:hypothetical protein SB748_32650, partial [Rhizobium sp. SIMBA_035]
YDVTLDVRSAADPAASGYASISIISFSATPGSATFLDYISGGVESVVLNGRVLDAANVVDGDRIILEGLAAENTVTVTGTSLYSRSGE